jgi:DNA gyrase/topoisomerase IV subunit A
MQLRARAAIDKIGRGAQERDAIVVTEIPFQVNKSKPHRINCGSRQRKTT